MFDTTVTSRRSSRGRALALATLAAGTVILGAPRVAHAEEVSPTGKGVIGGALLGGEVVVFIEGIAGVRSTPAYLVGAGVGAVGGGVGGYFIEQSVSDGRIPGYLLAGGLALIIPALVVALDQTRYLPTEGAREDRPVPNAPVSDPGKPGGSSVVGAEPAAPAAPAPAPAAPAPTPAAPGGGAGPAPTNAPQSLFNVRGGNFRVGLPVPEVRPVFTAAQKKTFAIEGAGNELRFPVVGLTF
jgi:hypothetical protein